MVSQVLSKHNRSVRIAQITDCHLKQAKIDEFYGCNPYKNLSKVLAEINEDQDKYQLVLFTGDLVQDECWSSYQNLLDAIHQYNWQIPFYVIPGNHDVPDCITRLRKIAPFKAGNVVAMDNWSLALFNSYSANRQGAGQITLAELEHLKNQLSQLFKTTETISLKHHEFRQMPDSQSKRHYILVVLHHHLVNFNSFIDKYALEDSLEFRNWIATEPSIKAIIHGHVHQFNSGTYKDKKWFSCAASSVQFEHPEVGFSIEKTTAGYNQILLNSDGSVKVTPSWVY